MRVQADKLLWNWQIVLSGLMYSRVQKVLIFQFVRLRFSWSSGRRQVLNVASKALCSLRLRFCVPESIDLWIDNRPCVESL